jgi:hypothetical protein
MGIVEIYDVHHSKQTMPHKTGSQSGPHKKSKWLISKYQKHASILPFAAPEPHRTGAVLHKWFILRYKIVTKWSTFYLDVTAGQRV